MINSLLETNGLCLKRKEMLTNKNGLVLFGKRLGKTVK